MIRRIDAPTIAVREVRIGKLKLRATHYRRHFRGQLDAYVVAVWWDLRDLLIIRHKR